MDTLLSRAEIPIIDLAHVVVAGEVEPSNSAARGVAAQLHRSLSEKGVVLLVNHGIADKKLQAAYAALDTFCELPEDVRNTYLRKAPHNHGYVPPGTEKFTQGGSKEVRHTFNVVRLDQELPEAEIPGFQSMAEALARDFLNLASLLLKVLAIGLDLPMDFFLATHRSILQSGNESCMRLLFYPPLDQPPIPGTTRCGEHADYGTFTLLAQDSEGGLEIQNNARHWGRVGHLPGAILVNTGELLAAWTNNQYPALRHRVVVPEHPLVRRRGRHSIAFFVHPDNETVIEPIQSTVLDSQPHGGRVASNKTVYTAYQHVHMRFQQTYVL